MRNRRDETTDEEFPKEYDNEEIVASGTVTLEDFKEPK